MPTPYGSFTGQLPSFVSPTANQLTAQGIAALSGGIKDAGQGVAQAIEKYKLHAEQSQATDQQIADSLAQAREAISKGDIMNPDSPESKLWKHVKGITGDEDAPGLHDSASKIPSLSLAKRKVIAQDLQFGLDRYYKQTDSDPQRQGQIIQNQRAQGQLQDENRARDIQKGLDAASPDILALPQYNTIPGKQVSVEEQKSLDQYGPSAPTPGVSIAEQADRYAKAQMDLGKISENLKKYQAMGGELQNKMNPNPNPRELPLAGKAALGFLPLGEIGRQLYNRAQQWAESPTQAQERIASASRQLPAVQKRIVDLTQAAEQAGKVPVPSQAIAPTSQPLPPMQVTERSQITTPEQQVPVSYADRVKQAQAILQQHGVPATAIGQVLPLLGAPPASETQLPSGIGSIVHMPSGKEEFVAAPKLTQEQQDQITARTVQFGGKQFLAPTREEGIKFREHQGETNDIYKGIDRLVKMVGASRLDFEDEAKASTFAKTLSGKLRLKLIGPGAMNVMEMNLLDAIVAKPTKILSLDSSNRARLEALRSRVQDTLDGEAQALGFIPQASDASRMKDYSSDPRLK